MLVNLARLSGLCARRNAGAPEILEACEIVREAIGADEVYVVQAGDPYFSRIGDDSPAESYEIKQRGYWLVWQELARDETVTFGAFDVKDRLVMDGRPVETAHDFSHVACLLPADESNSELLIARGCWPRGLSPKTRHFLNAARPIVACLVAKFLDSKRQARQQQQLKALAQVARAFSEAHETDNVLQAVATALAKASGFDWVTISVLDDDCSQVVDRAMNIARHSGTKTAEMSMRRVTPTDFLRELNENRKPRLTPDVLSDPGVTDELRAYYQRAHILSSAIFPMLFQERMLGYIVFSSSTKRSFDEAEVDFISDLVSQATTTIKGVRLYKELEQAREIQHFLARTDALTGIPNRRYFEEVLKAEFARAQRYAEPLCLLMADLDHFKNINDRLGHQYGDEALRHVATVARETCRQSDFVGRWGGDEFVFILPKTPMGGGVIFAERLQHLLAEMPFLPPGSEQAWPMTISVGVAQCDSLLYANPEELVEAADKALYQAKEGGRDRVETAAVSAIAA